MHQLKKYFHPKIARDPVRKHSLFIGSILLVTAFCYFLLSASLHYRIGNMFFGQVPSLYNITLAHFFFTRASYPLFGQAAPEFAHYELSRTNFIRGDFKQSIAEAQRELACYPDNSRTYYILGLTYGYVGEERRAIDAFTKFIDTHPETWAARNDKAWLQFRIGDIDGALSTIMPVAAMTTNPWVQNTYGTLLMNKDRNIEARQAFQSAKNAANSMKGTTWGMAYPGNDPRIYDAGLNAMRASIDNNLQLLDGK